MHTQYITLFMPKNLRNAVSYKLYMKLFLPRYFSLLVTKRTNLYIFLSHKSNMYAFESAVIKDTNQTILAIEKALLKNVHVPWNLNNTLHFEELFLSSQFVTTPILYNIHITGINIQYSKGVAI